MEALSDQVTCIFKKLLITVIAQFNIQRYLEDVQWFYVEYGIYFTSETGFFITPPLPIFS